MYNRVRQGWMKHLDFILIDVLCLHLAFLLAYYIRHGFAVSPYSVKIYQGLALVMTVVDIVIAAMFNTMHGVLKRENFGEATATIKHCLFVFATLIVYMFSTQSGEAYSRIVLYIMLVLYSVFGYAGRLIWKKHLHSRGLKVRSNSMLVVTDAENAEKVIADLKSASNSTYKITGIILTDEKRDCIGDVPVVCAIEDAAEYICREWVDEVFFRTEKSFEGTRRLIAQCREMGVVVHEALSLEDGVGQRQFLEKVGGYQVLTSSVNYATAMQSTLKRLLDIAGGIVGVILTGIIVIIIGPKLKKASPGPIFFSQERIGKNGKRFRIYKIRSMYLDAEERKQALMSQNRVADGMMFKLDFDPRIIGNEILPDGSRKTGIGDLIRRTSLDEFPQFWNVLKGDMSLVGTRPPTVDEWEKYQLHHRARLSMKPGITGLWQVSGRSEITDFEEVVKLDTEYIYNWSIGLDLKILVQTVKSVLKHDGAM